MARYFFDIDDGSRPVRDEVGLDLDGRGEVLRAGRLILLDLAQAARVAGQERSFTVSVRDGRGASIHRASAWVEVEPMAVV